MELGDGDLNPQKEQIKNNAVLFYVKIFTRIKQVKMQRYVSIFLALGGNKTDYGKVNSK